MSSDTMSESTKLKIKRAKEAETWFLNTMMQPNMFEPEFTAKDLKDYERSSHFGNSLQ